MSRSEVIVPLDFGGGKIAKLSVTELMTAADREFLAHLASNASVAYDVGAFTGSSGEAILCGMKPDGVCYSVDTFRGVGGEHDYPSQVPRWLGISAWATRVARFGDRARLYVGESVEFARMQKPDTADLVFLDAAHSYSAVMADIDAWAPVLKSGGILAGHDFDKRLTKVPVEEILKHRDMEFAGVDFGGGSGEIVHFGVVAAVMGSFEGFGVAEDPDSTIWWVQKP